MDAATVRERAGDLPREPGVYQFLAPDDRTLYVGKAVDLPDRVRSYADPRGRRIAAMVDRAETIEVAVTDTETQALLLEANLIKRHSPRYNVRLKDDKSYPVVELTDHETPRIGITRDPEPGSSVFGPYTEKTRVEVVVKALREAFGVRGCSDHKYAGRDRPCLDHDLGLCTAPCTGEIGAEEYLADVESVRRFLDGETGLLADPLRAEMEEAAESGNFERAANCRDRLAAVEAFHGGSSAAVAGGDDDRTTDVLGAVVEGETATVARLASEHGKLVDRERRRLDVPEADNGGDDGDPSAGGGEPVAGVLGAFVAQYYAERALPDRLLVPERPDDPELLAWLDTEEVEVRVPGAGREATLVDLALKNARRGRERDSGTAALADRLGIESATRIEGFDVSHASGRAAVGSDVAFLDGEPDKSGYRRKKVHDENDDYANMHALLSWRAARAVESASGHSRDDRPDPDLLVIDGGEGQLNAAREALDEHDWDVPAIGLAKAEERVVTPDGEFAWPDDAPELHLLQRVRDEAHRFAVQYHQTVRDEVSTVLDEVSGIGPQTRTNLLRRFGSVDGVRAASTEELRSVSGVGEKTAETLRARL